MSYYMREGKVDINECSQNGPEGKNRIYAE